MDNLTERLKMTLDRKGRVRHWREMAAHALYAARDALDPQTRATLISLSRVYEEFALQAELAPLSDDEPEAPMEKPDRGSDEGDSEPPNSCP